MAKRDLPGFTIVEILVIVVTIGILATIGVVAYNGIQDRARLQVARSEMHSFAKAAAVYKETTGTLPVSNAGFIEVLKDAGLYYSTRSEVKNFAICASTIGYAFVAWNPIIDGIKRGSTLYLYQDAGGQNIHTLTNSSLESNLQLSKVCEQVYPEATYEVWTHELYP